MFTYVSLGKDGLSGYLRRNWYKATLKVFSDVLLDTSYGKRFHSFGPMCMKELSLSVWNLELALMIGCK